MKLPAYLTKLKPASAPSPAKAKKRALLINVSNIKKLMLAYSKETRAGKYTRVGRDTIEAANRHMDAFCLKVVADARGGKTL